MPFSVKEHQLDFRTLIYISSDEKENISIMSRVTNLTLRHEFNLGNVINPQGMTARLREGHLTIIKALSTKKGTFT